MSSKKRKQYTAHFKFQVVMEAIRVENKLNRVVNAG